MNVYVAMCYYKLDYYDVSLEILAAYLQAQPDSATAINLKACNHFRLYNGKAAEAELKVLTDRGVNLQAIELIRHNMVVFSNGDQAQQILPGLVDVIPEARLNLVRTARRIIYASLHAMHGLILLGWGSMLMCGTGHLLPAPQPGAGGARPHARCRAHHSAGEGGGGGTD